MRTISQKKFNELNDHLEYDGVDEVFLAELYDATGITAEPYTSYRFYNEDGDYAGNSEEDLCDILRYAGVGVRKENYND